MSDFLLQHDKELDEAIETDEATEAVRLFEDPGKESAKLDQPTEPTGPGSPDASVVEVGQKPLTVSRSGILRSTKGARLQGRHRGRLTTIGRFSARNAG